MLRFGSKVLKYCSFVPSLRLHQKQCQKAYNSKFAGGGGGGGGGGMELLTLSTAFHRAYIVQLFAAGPTENSYLGACIKVRGNNDLGLHIGRHSYIIHLHWLHGNTTFETKT